MTWVPQQLVGAYVGQELTLACNTEAFPKSINYWVNEQGDMIVSGQECYGSVVFLCCLWKLLDSPVGLVMVLRRDCKCTRSHVISHSVDIIIPFLVFRYLVS